MSTNVTNDNPLQAPLASPMDVSDVKTEGSALRVTLDRVVLGLYDATTKLQKTKRFKNHVAQRSVQIDLLHAAKQQSHEDLQAQPHVGLGDYKGLEHFAAVEAYEVANKTYKRAKKRLGVLKELLEKMESDTIIQEYLVKGDQWHS